MDKIRLQLPAADNGCLARAGCAVFAAAISMQCCQYLCLHIIMATIVHNVLIRESAHIQI